MVDRESRNQMLAILDDYLSGKIKTFVFEERRDALKTQDEAVRYIACISWYLHDDFIDHPARLTRQGWNFVQRLRLILQSDAEIVTQHRWNFTLYHAAILLGVAFLILICCRDGFGWQFWGADIVIGMIFFYFMNHRKFTSRRSGLSGAASELIPAAEINPFDSFAAMRDTYESVAEFHKMPFPRTMDLTPLRSKRTERLMFLPWLVGWPMLVLLVLLAIRVAKYTVRPPRAATT